MGTGDIENALIIFWFHTLAEVLCFPMALFNPRAAGNSMAAGWGISSKLLFVEALQDATRPTSANFVS